MTSNPQPPTSSNQLPATSNHFKIGFHCGLAGNARGIGDYFRALDSAATPAILKSADDYGVCHELANLRRRSGVPHEIVFRLVRPNDRYNYDVPLYHLAPEDAARIHWQKTLAALPPEFDKDLVWLEVINEVDKERSDWIGLFSSLIASAAIANDFMVALPGWSAGEPEAEHWLTPGMKMFLEICAQRPDRVAVALHEYSYNHQSLYHSLPHPFPYQIGRVEQLFTACDAMGIARPNVYITEFGGGKDGCPSPNVGIEQLEWAGNLYNTWPQVKMAAIWNLGGGDNNMANKVQPYIAPLVQLALNWQPAEPPEPKPPPPPEPEPPAEPQFLIIEVKTHIKIPRPPSLSDDQWTELQETIRQAMNNQPPATSTQPPIPSPQE